jgi:cathepsin L
MLVAMLVSPVMSPQPVQNLRSFEGFERAHGKTYASAAARARRARIYADNQRDVEGHNARADMGEHTFWLTLNEWADLTHAEWMQQVGLPPLTTVTTKTEHSPTTLTGQPLFERTKVDWTSPETCKQPAGCVSPVKNQGYCGSCWCARQPITASVSCLPLNGFCGPAGRAFSAVGAIESAYAIATGTLVNGSVQQVVDCQGGASACQGGDTQDAVLYVMASGGLASEED